MNCNKNMLDFRNRRSVRLLHFLAVGIPAYQRCIGNVALSLIGPNQALLQEATVRRKATIMETSQEIPEVDLFRFKKPILCVN